MIAGYNLVPRSCQPMMGLPMWEVSGFKRPKEGVPKLWEVPRLMKCRSP